MKYLDKDRKLGIFHTKKKIKLLDIRYVSQIINELILLRKSNDFEIIKGYMTLSLSYGLISLYKQLNLYKIKYSEGIESDTRYKKIIEYYNNFESKQKELFQNPLELQGIRICEINNDIESTFILKEIFEDFFDGIISPTIFSPYFDDNYLENEILLFNPVNCLKKINKIPKNIVSLNMNDLLVKQGIELFSVSYFMKDNEKTHFYYKGGGKIDYIYEKNNLINKTKKIEQVKIFKNMIKQNNFRKNDYIYKKNNLINN
jgi:hypothetical protein